MEGSDNDEGQDKEEEETQDNMNHDIVEEE